MYIGEDLLDRAEDPGDLLYGTIQQVHELCTYYVAFDVSQAPFDDPRIREAFTKSIDRERYNEVVNEGEGVIAKGLYPPGLPGYNSDLRPVAFDLAEAEQALAGSTYGSAAALPEIVLTAAGEGTDLSPGDAILIQMWEEALGVSIQVEQIDYQSYMDEVYAGNHGQILTSGWCADYPDPENFADVLFHSGSSQNLSNYSNPSLDAMLDRARSLQDTAGRIALYQEIEQIIVDEMPVAFLIHDSSPTYLLMKPYVHGYQTTPIGIAQLMNVGIDE
jgi:oligopeptide transport system substrate-binding protein